MLRTDQFLNQFAPDQIYQKLQDAVIGQDDAKRALVSAVWWNLYRSALLAAGQDSRVLPAKLNVLLIGPSGIGKTELAKATASAFGVPWITTAAPNYSSAGYTGADVDDMLGMLLQAAGGDSDAAERGIVVLDEVDKLRRRDFGGQSDVGCEAIQQALLSLLEGCEAMPRARGGERVKMRSHFVTFVGTGAFLGLSSLPGPVSSAALVAEGFLPEFIARWSMRIRLQDVDRDMLRRIVSSKRSALNRLGHLFGLHGIEMIVDEKAIESLIEQALTDGVGVRALNETIWNRLNSLIAEIPQMVQMGVGRVVIDSASMRGLPAWKIPSSNELPESARALVHPIKAAEPIDLSGWSKEELNERLKFLLEHLAFAKAKPESQSAFEHALRIRGCDSKPQVGVRLCEQMAFAISPACSIDEFCAAAAESESPNGEAILALVRYRRLITREGKSPRARVPRKRPLCRECSATIPPKFTHCPACGTLAEVPPG